jgi:hypothetical protein
MAFPDSPPLLRAHLSSVELPPPRDWQAFQRKCVPLFRRMLNDPHAGEYGRGGQNQRGIDILLHRNADPDQPIGIQCRRVAKPLRKKKIRTDCDEALAHFPDLREIIFACTAEDDTHATDDARTVEADLRAAGYDLRVILYGWEQLRGRIVDYQEAIEAFFPTLVPASLPTIAPSTFFQVAVATMAPDVVSQIAGAVAIARTCRPHHPPHPLPQSKQPGTAKTLPCTPGSTPTATYSRTTNARSKPRLVCGGCLTMSTSTTSRTRNSAS